MVYALTAACGVVLAALSICCYLTRQADSPTARSLRRAFLFVVPLFLAGLLFSAHQQWLLATADTVNSNTTIGQIETAIDRVRLPYFLDAVLHRDGAAVPTAGLLLLALLPFVKTGAPFLGMDRRAAGALGAVYVAATLLLSGVAFGRGAAQNVDARVARLQGHIEDVARKAAAFKADIDDAAREIVREGLIETLGIADLQMQVDAVRDSLRNAQVEIEPYREVLRDTGQRFRGDTLASDFGDTWRDVQRALNDLHWNRRTPAVTVPDTGRSTWSTLRIYEASADLRNFKLSRPKEEPSALHDMVAKIFDIVYAEGGRSDLGSGLEVPLGHPLAPLVGSLVEVWYEPLNVVSRAQAEALFHATVAQRQPFADAAEAARVEVRLAIEPFRAALQPGLDDVALSLQRLRNEALRLPQSYSRFAENIYPERLKAFQRTWHRLLSFSTPDAARAATNLRQQTEAVLTAPADPIEKHQQIAAYEQTLQAIARQVDENGRYQALLHLEQQVLEGKPEARSFARFTKQHVESRLLGHLQTGNGGRGAPDSLVELETLSELLETHRLAESGLLSDPANERDPESRERILQHLSFDLEFMTRAILEEYRPDIYTAETFRTRLRRYAKLAQALEPAFAQGGEFVDTISGNLTGRSAKGAMRFEIVHLIAKSEARLRLAPSEASLKLADLLREERDFLAVYQNGSDDRYVRALFELWQDADRQPELGARISETVVDSIENDSQRLKVPAVGAIRGLRDLVEQSKEKAQEVKLLRQQLAALDMPDAALKKALTVSHARFLWLQEQIRRDWARARRQLHISAAYRSR